jgi:hypothetical protein
LLGLGGARCRAGRLGLAPPHQPDRAWGGYRPAGEWEKAYRRRDGSTGKLGRTTTRKGRLTEALLARHFRASDRADLVGLHSTGPDNTSFWGGLDIDWHGPTSTTPAVNLRAVLAWYDWLLCLGFHPCSPTATAPAAITCSSSWREPSRPPASTTSCGA